MNQCLTRNQISLCKHRGKITINSLEPIKDLNCKRTKKILIELKQSGLEVLSIIQANHAYNFKDISNFLLFFELECIRYQVYCVYELFFDHSRILISICFNRFKELNFKIFVCIPLFRIKSMSNSFGLRYLAQFALNTNFIY